MSDKPPYFILSFSSKLLFAFHRLSWWGNYPASHCSLPHALFTPEFLGEVARKRLESSYDGYSAEVQGEAP